MRCRVCRSPDLDRLWENPNGGGTAWWACRACGSHNHDLDPAAVAGDYLTAAYRDQTGGPVPFDHGTEPLTANVEWFAGHRPAGDSFLDVGCLTGAGMRAMAAAGWKVQGFDVNPHCAGPGVTVYPHFAAGLFAGRFDAVLCREVVEHVAGWRMLLAELFRVTKPGGVVQVQTPAPTPEPAPNVHQRHHLQIFAPAELERWCRWAGLEPLDRRGWENGQALMLRRLT